MNTPRAAPFRSARRIVLLGLTLTSALTPAAWAGPGSWTPLGPESATVTAIATDPRHPATVYAGTATGGMFKSLDGGVSWRPASSSLATGGVLPPIGLLTVDPFRSASVYAGALFSGLYRSRDGGASWERIGHGLEGPQGGIRPFSLLADPARPQTLYAGTANGVFRSRDRGESWSPFRNGLPPAPINALAFDPAGNLLAALQAGFLYRSESATRKWKRVNVGPMPPAYELGIDPRSPTTLYVQSNLALYRSTNGGKTWGPAAEGRVAGTPLGIGFRDRTAYAATGLGLFQSADGGGSWSPTAAQPADPVLRSFTVTPNTLYLGTDGTAAIGGVFRSTDGGATWERLPTSGLPEGAIGQVAIDQALPGVLYAVSGRGLYRTDDLGSTWRKWLDLGTQGGAVLATREALYAARSGLGVLRSPDHGESWTTIRSGLGARLTTRLTVDPTNPHHLFAATSNGGLWEYTVPEGEGAP